MPREAPVITARRPARGGSARTRESPQQLITPRPILPGPGYTFIALLRRSVQRPVGIDEMRACKTAKIRTPRGEDAVHVIDLIDVADCHGGDARFIADEIGK